MFEENQYDKNKFFTTPGSVNFLKSFDQEEILPPPKINLKLSPKIVQKHQYETPYPSFDIETIPDLPIFGSPEVFLNPDHFNLTVSDEKEELNIFDPNNFNV